MRKISIFNFVFSFVFFCSINSSHAMQYIEKAGGQVYNWGCNTWYESFASEGAIFAKLDDKLKYGQKDEPGSVAFFFKFFVNRAEKDERYNAGIVSLLKQAIDTNKDESLAVMADLLSEKKEMRDKISCMNIKDRVYGFDGCTVLGYAVSKRDVVATEVLYPGFLKISTLKDNNTMIQSFNNSASQKNTSKLTSYERQIQKERRCRIKKDFEKIKGIVCIQKQLAS